jgi:hypothetical protein
MEGLLWCASSVAVLVRLGAWWKPPDPGEETRADAGRLLDTQVVYSLKAGGISGGCTTTLKRSCTELTSVRRFEQSPKLLKILAISNDLQGSGHADL